jgi:pentatricopeptide repeat protein
MAAAHAAIGETTHAHQLLEEAGQLLTEIGESPQAWIWDAFLSQLYCCVAAAFARVGESDKALDYLEKAVNHGWRDPHWLASDPEFTSLRAQPRFQALLDTLERLPPVDFTSAARP